MAAKPKYVELVVNNEGMPVHTLAGYVVVSDYKSDGNRHLFFRKASDITARTLKAEAAGAEKSDQGS